MKLDDWIEGHMLKQDDANHIVWAAAICAFGTLFYSLPIGWILAFSCILIKEFLLDHEPTLGDILFGAAGVMLASAAAFPGVVRYFF